jgi:peptide deformylase
MSHLNIVLFPDPILKMKAAPVKIIDKEIKELMAEMTKMLYKKPAGGYAAPQFGILKRIIVVDDSYGKDPTRQFRMVNPEIIWASEEEVSMAEGCMSIPWGRVEVMRPEKVKIRYLNENGEICETDIEEDYMGRCLQHEIDHLDGILSLDHATKIRREMFIKKINRRRELGKSFDD